MSQHRLGSSEFQNQLGVALARNLKATRCSDCAGAVQCYRSGCISAVLRQRIYYINSTAQQDRVALRCSRARAPLRADTATLCGASGSRRPGGPAARRPGEGFRLAAALRRARAGGRGRGPLGRVGLLVEPAPPPPPPPQPPPQPQPPPPPPIPRRDSHRRKPSYSEGPGTGPSGLLPRGRCGAEADGGGRQSGAGPRACSAAAISST